MKTIYWDVSDMREKDGPIAIFSSKVNVVSAGTTFRVMSPARGSRRPVWGDRGAVRHLLFLLGPG